MFLLLLLCLSAGAAWADEHIFVEGRINDQPARFIFDTGWQNFALFPKSAARFGLKWTNPPSNIQLPPGKVPAGISEECKVTFGETSSRAAFNVVDLPAYLNFHADGVLGWWALKQNILRINAAELKVECLEKMPSEAAAWIKLAVRNNSDYLMMEIPGDGTNLAVILIDTGKDHGVTLNPRKWNEWKTVNTKQPRTITAGYMPGAGIVVKEEAWAREFDFGPLHLTDIPVTEANQVELSAGGPGCAAWLGLAALKQFDFIVDGKNGFAYFHPKQGPCAPYQHNRLGAVVRAGGIFGRRPRGPPSWTAVRLMRRASATAVIL